MATDQSTVIAPAVFQLPVTGRRGGQSVVVAYAIVLDDDFAHTVLAATSWQLHPQGYVQRRGPRDESGFRRTEYLHQAVFARHHGELPEGTEIDHIDRNKLNNLPDNLRAATSGLNKANRGKLRSNTSGFVGVYWHKADRKWVANVRVNGRRSSLGRYLTPREAADAVNRAYAEHYPLLPIPNPTV